MLYEYLTPVVHDGPQYGTTGWNTAPYYNKINSWAQSEASSIVSTAAANTYVNINFRLNTGMNVKSISEITIQTYAKAVALTTNLSISIVKDNGSSYDDAIGTENESVSTTSAIRSTLISGLSMSPEDFDNNYYIQLNSPSGNDINLYEMRIKIGYSSERTFSPKI